MKFRSLFVALVLLAAMALGGLTSAQDIDPCLGLSADDCSVINNASANGLGDAESFTLELTIDFSATGIPDPTLPAVTYNQSGTIAVTFGSGMLLPFDMAGDFDVSFSSGDMGEETITVEFLLIEDMLYIADPTGEVDWVSIDLVALLENEDVQMQLEPALDALESGDLGAVTGGAELPDAEALLPLVDLLNLPGLLTYVREGDDFIFTLDFGALATLLDPENEELLNSIIDAASEVDPTAAFLIPAIPTLIESGTIGVVQTVDTDANIVTDIRFTTNIIASLAAMTTGEVDAPPTAVELDVDLGFVELGSTTIPEAPADALDVTDDFLEGLLSGL